MDSNIGFLIKKVINIHDKIIFIVFVFRIAVIIIAHPNLGIKRELSEFNVFFYY